MSENTTESIFKRKRKLWISLTIIVVLLIVQFMPTILLPYFPPTYEPSHRVTIWIEPRNESFRLNMDFYGSEEDSILELNQVFGLSRIIDPNDSIVIEHTVYAIPKEHTSFWIVIEIDDGEKITSSLLIGVRTVIDYLGSQIEVLIVFS